MQLIRPLAAALLVTLAACTSSDQTGLPACPKTTILEGTASLTRFLDGAGRDLIDVDFNAEIESLKGSCLYDVDSSGAGLLNMEVEIEVKLDRGPANKDRKANFDYFVTILDSNGNILNKAIFPFTAEFYGNKTTSRSTDAPVQLSIPVTAEQGGQDFRVYVGFQLTPEELRYNRDKYRPGNS